MRILNSQDPTVKGLLKKQVANIEEIEARVQEILKAVRDQGDEAVFAFTRQFDRALINTQNFRVTEEEIKEASTQVEPEVLTAIRQAAENIRQFHEKQKVNSWMEPDAQGTILGQLCRPLARVGIYVPGGTAPLPSSVLMNAIPAQVAGVREIVMTTPPQADGRINPYILVAAAEAGVTEIYKVGGAQAVAALAYGTESVRKVDKIAGPGNIYVTIAKKLVYGEVDIDMLAGPSEVLVIADGTANPRYVAADLLSQAEHDVLASAILVTPSTALAEAVQVEVERQLAVLSRQDIALTAIRDYGAIILTTDLAEAVEIANEFAPEHLELLVERPFELLGGIKNAGAIFLGTYSPEPVGDYWAGPNHVLPTGGTARFYSPLSVDTFIKKSSIIAYSETSFRQGAAAIIKLAMIEGLDAHANSVRVRLDG
ncbi:MAG: histidinol dehydrogenase [Firmicutes bacterium]|nr:histidinol dehydrogenase [Bacillota bacterium]